MTTQAQQPAMGEDGYPTDAELDEAVNATFYRNRPDLRTPSVNPESVGDDVVGRFRFVVTHARDDLPLNMCVPAARVLLARIEADAATIATLQAEKEQLNGRLAETQMLAFKWMEAHDKRAADKPYDFPKPADYPDALATLQAKVKMLESLLLFTRSAFAQMDEVFAAAGAIEAREALIRLFARIDAALATEEPK